jgi:hypothetical protein
MRPLVLFFNVASNFFNDLYLQNHKYGCNKNAHSNIFIAGIGYAPVSCHQGYKNTDIVNGIK